MDGRGGCCIARYAGGGGGGGGGAYDRSKMDRIMLRFRPIAPKPASSVSVSGGTSPEKSDILVGTGRPKRRYVRDRNNTNKNSNTNKKRKKKAVSLPETGTEAIVTFPFLPEKPDQREEQTEVGSPDSLPFDLTVERNPVQNLPIWMNSNNNNNSSHPTVVMPQPVRSSHVVMPQPVRPVGSCIVVGCLTETFMDGAEGIGLMGCTDEEKRYNLEIDTCPGFISDGLNRVRWTNEAYRKMVSQDGVVDHQYQQQQEARPEMVWLVIEKGLPVEYPAFTCRVRLQYTYTKERSSLTVPCDVWRMDGGGFAWRLDVKAALCLGR